MNNTNKENAVIEFKVGDKVKLKSINEVYMTDGDGDKPIIGNTYTIHEDCGIDDSDYNGYYSIDKYGHNMMWHSDLEIVK